MKIADRIKVVATFLIILFWVTVSVYAGTDSGLVTCGTGSPSGLYYPTGIALGDQVNKDARENGFRFAVESTSGSRYNLRSVQNRELDFGFVQSDVHFQAYNGTGRFVKKGKAKNLRSVMSIAPEPMHVITLASSDINDLAGLKGKTVNVGKRGSGHQVTFLALMDAMSWKEGDFKKLAMNKSSEQLDSLCSGQIDAMVVSIAAYNKLVTDLANRCDIKLIPIKGDKVDAFVQKNSFWVKTVIPGGAYKGVDQDTVSFGAITTMVTNMDVEKDIVYHLVKEVFERFEDMKKAHPAFRDLVKERMIKDGLAAPLHEGAAKYFKEAGLL